MHVHRFGDARERSAHLGVLQHPLGSGQVGSCGFQRGLRTGCSETQVFQGILADELPGVEVAPALQLVTRLFEIDLARAHPGRRLVTRDQRPLPVQPDEHLAGPHRVARLHGPGHHPAVGLRCDRGGAECLHDAGGGSLPADIGHRCGLHPHMHRSDQRRRHGIDAVATLAFRGGICRRTVAACIECDDADELKYRSQNIEYKGVNLGDERPNQRGASGWR